MSYSQSPGKVLRDYAHLRTIPAILGIIFAISSLYQFGGISEVNIVWLDYVLTNEHAMVTSLFVFVIAFLSSETKDFDYYDDWEKALVIAGPLLIILHYGFLSGFVADYHAAGMIAFLISLTSWGVAVR